MVKPDARVGAGGLLIVVVLALMAVGARADAGGRIPMSKKSQGPLEIYFDGRAKHVRVLTSETEVTQGGRAQWACLCFVGADIALAEDPRFGTVYSITTGPSSHNPFLAPSPRDAGSETSVRRPIRLGHWDWYANSYKALPGWTLTDWGTVTQMNYPSLTSPPLEIDFDRYGVGIERSAGFVPSMGARAPIHDVRRFFSVSSVIGKWVDFVVGVRWATDTTGKIRVFTRCRECGDRHWVRRYAKDRIVTMQWGAGVINANGTSVSSGREASTLDKEGLYYGYYRPTSLPTNHILEMGLVRAGSESAAMAAIP